IEMPRMHGYELATAMPADGRIRDVPIVMITSRTVDKHRRRSIETGVPRDLGQTYQGLDLIRNVYDLLGIARARDSYPPGPGPAGPARPGPRPPAPGPGRRRHPRGAGGRS